MPRAAKVTTDATTAAAATESAAPYKKTVPSKRGGKKPEPGSPDDPLLFLTTVELAGEDNGEVPIYDSCDEVRRKIHAFFRDPKFSGVTQKRFREECGNVAPGSYQLFMKKKGPTAGAEMALYRYAYIFFEKKRVHEKKPKTKSRLTAENQFPCGRDFIDLNRPRWVFTG